MKYNDDSGNSMWVLVTLGHSFKNISFHVEVGSARVFCVLVTPQRGLDPRSERLMSECNLPSAVAESPHRHASIATP